MLSEMDIQAVDGLIKKNRKLERLATTERAIAEVFSQEYDWVEEIITRELGGRRDPAMSQADCLDLIISLYRIHGGHQCHT